MRVLVGCEFSQIVTRAFRLRGHEAFSCDLEPTEGNPAWHLQADLLTVLDDHWDIGIFHPPCDYLTNSGVQWLHRLPRKPRGDVLYGTERWRALDEACAFFRALLDAPIPLIAVENPIPHKYAVERIGRSYNQLIQPWQFGHGETKATCLWLKGLPPLMSTSIVTGRTQRVFHESPGPQRKKNRARTFTGVASAMADQWGSL